MDGGTCTVMHVCTQVSSIHSKGCVVVLTHSLHDLSLLHRSLTKDVEKRPYYAELLGHPLIKNYETLSVDLGDWFQEQCRLHGNP